MRYQFFELAAGHVPLIACAVATFNYTLLIDVC